MKYRIGFGEDSHRFLETPSSKPCILGGVPFEGLPGFKSNSDGDVIFHAICNAITSITGVLILGGIADELCLKRGIVDSSIYLMEALKTLQDIQIVHLAISVEGKRPLLKQSFPQMKSNIAQILSLSASSIGITSTSGEELSDFGRGKGVKVSALLTCVENTPI